METLPFSNFPKLQNLVYLFYSKFSNSAKNKKIINSLFQCLFLVYVLLGISINEHVLMMWRNHFDGVPNVLIENTNILSEGAGNATLRLRRHFMRTCYVPRDVPESATNASPELNDSIRVLNFTRSDGDKSEGTVSHTTD